MRSGKSLYSLQQQFLSLALGLKGKLDFFERYEFQFELSTFYYF